MVVSPEGDCPWELDTWSCMPCLNAALWDGESSLSRNGSETLSGSWVGRQVCVSQL